MFINPEDLSLKTNTADPLENCYLTVKKLPKTCHFSKKLTKMVFWHFFFKWKVLVNFLTVKWKFSGGSATQYHRLVRFGYNVGQISTK